MLKNNLTRYAAAFPAICAVSAWLYRKSRFDRPGLEPVENGNPPEGHRDGVAAGLTMTTK